MRINYPHEYLGTPTRQYPTVGGIAISNGRFCSRGLSQQTGKPTEKAFLRKVDLIMTLPFSPVNLLTDCILLFPKQTLEKGTGN